MSELVLELQSDALNSEIKISELLRKALVVARKLGIDDFAEWVSKELNGYTAETEIPDYREIDTEVVVFNPYHGWLPLNFRNADVAKSLSRKKIHQPIGELASLVNNSDEASSLGIPFPQELANQLMKNMHPPLRPALRISSVQIQGIIDAVRNIVLNWSIELEQKGILGKNMTFSKKEKDAATSVTHITNYFGNISNSPFQQGSPGAFQIVNYTLKEELDKEELVEFTVKLENFVNQITELRLGEIKEDLGKLKLRLDTIKLYLEAEYEDPSFVEESLKTTRSLLENIVGSAIVTAALSPNLQQLATHLLHQVSSWFY